MSTTPYEVGETVTAKHRRMTYTGEIKAIGAQPGKRTKGKDMRPVTIAARWEDMARRVHVTDIEVPYCAITARLEQGNQ